jgi:hypothetical protein
MEDMPNENDSEDLAPNFHGAYRKPDEEGEPTRSLNPIKSLEMSVLHDLIMRLIPMAMFSQMMI